MVNGFEGIDVVREIDELSTVVVSQPTGDRPVRLFGPSAVPRLSSLARPATAPAVALINGSSFAEFNEVRRSGVRGLVMIDEAAEELEFALTSVANGRPFLSAPFASRILDWISDRTSGKHVYRGPAATELTDREYEVLILLGRGRTNEEIAGELNVRNTTVRSHICHILTKLNLRNRTAAVLFAIQSELYGCFF
jgi:DNA-binding NarL/FixJ family response regulator